MKATNPATAQASRQHKHLLQHLLMNGYIIVLPEGTLTSETPSQSNNARTLQHHRAVGHTGTVSKGRHGLRRYRTPRRHPIRFAGGYGIQHPRQPYGDAGEAHHAYARIERGRNTTAFELRPQRAILSVWGNRSQHYDRKRPSIYD